jgi:hypothetical protein
MTISSQLRNIGFDYLRTTIAGSMTSSRDDLSLVTNGEHAPGKRTRRSALSVSGFFDPLSFLLAQNHAINTDCKQLTSSLGRAESSRTRAGSQLPALAIKCPMVPRQTNRRRYPAHRPIRQEILGSHVKLTPVHCRSSS